MLSRLQGKKPVVIVTAIIFVISAIQMILWVIQSPSIQTTSGTITFISKRGGVNLIYPQEWHYIDSPKGYAGDPIALLRYPNGLKLGVSGAIYKSVATMGSLENVMGWGKQIAQPSKEHTEISIGQLLIENEETLIREYGWLAPATPIGPAQPIRCIENYRLHNQIGYVFTLCVNEEDYQNMKPMFVQAIQSLSYLD